MSQKPKLKISSKRSSLAGSTKRPFTSGTLLSTDIQKRKRKEMKNIIWILQVKASSSCTFDELWVCKTEAEAEEKLQMLMTITDRFKLDIKYQLQSHEVK